MKMSSKVEYLRQDWDISSIKKVFFCPQDLVYSESNCKCLAREISLLTAVKNRPVQFERMLKSINSQKPTSNLNQIEHVVVDASEDPSLQQLIFNASKIHTVYCFGQDMSLYDGFNMARHLSHGRFLCYINSDDWYESNFVKDSYDYISLTGADWVFGDTVIHTKKLGKIYANGKPDYMIKPWLNFSRFHHTTVMARREMFDVIGDFPHAITFRPLRLNIKLTVAADYWWFLKAQRLGFSAAYDRRLIGHMDDGGASQQNRSRSYFEAMAIASNVWSSKIVQILVIWSLRYIYDFFLVKIQVRFLKRIISKMPILYRKLTRSN